MRLRDNLSILCPGGRVVSISTDAIFTGSPDAMKIDNDVSEIKKYGPEKSDT